MPHVLITGASGNLGAAVVKKFLDNGYVVSGSGSGESGEGVNVVPVDLADATKAAEFVQSALSLHSRIDVALLTVGGFTPGRLFDTTAADIEKQLNLNFATAFNVAQPVLKHMLENKQGRIFLVGSKPGLHMKDATGAVAYGLSKSLIFNLAELMNHESRKTNVVTSVIIPSTIDTPANRKAMPDADFSSWVTPQQIADIIYFYTTREADAVAEPVIKIYGRSM